MAIELNDKFSGFQVRVLVMCFFINLLDGLDLFAMAYAGPAVSDEWSLPPQSLGIVLSGVFIGMAAGAVLIGPLCDYVGRRKVVLCGISLMAVSMVATPLATNVPELLVYRILTGLGIGATLPGITSLVAEYSPDKFRNLSVSCLHVAAPMGSILGGSLAALLIEKFGWQSVFLVSGALTFIVTINAYFILPESPEFLSAKGDPESLARLADISARLGQNITTTSYEASGRSDSVIGLAALFRDEYRRWSPLLWVSCFCLLATLYFVLSWMPKVLVDAGLSLNWAIYIGVANSVGSIIGLLAMGYLSQRYGLRRLQRLSFIAAALLMVVFGFSPPNVLLLSLVGFALGVFFSGAYISIWITAVRIYDASARASGIGWTIGLGRFGAILGPLMAGILMSMGWSRGWNFTAFALPLLVAFAAVALIKSPRLEHKRSVGR